MAKTPTAIVIEDDENMVEIFVEWIKMAGVSVLATGYNGNDAVELFKMHKPDVVILDLMMPVFDGFYAIDGIQKIDPSAKFLILTADVTVKTKERLHSLNINSLMYKPYDLDEVVNEVKRITTQIAVH